MLTQEPFARRWLTILTDREPADSVLNTEAGKGRSAPFDPWGTDPPPAQATNRP